MTFYDLCEISFEIGTVFEFSLTLLTISVRTSNEMLAYIISLSLGLFDVRIREYFDLYIVWVQACCMHYFCTHKRMTVKKNLDIGIEFSTTPLCMYYPLVQELEVEYRNRCTSVVGIPCNMGVRRRGWVRCLILRNSLLKLCYYWICLEMPS